MKTTRKTYCHTAQAAADHDALPQATKEAIDAALDRLAAGDERNVKALVGTPRLYRLRVGNYRVIFEQTTDLITILYVGKRDERTYR